MCLSRENCSSNIEVEVNFLIRRFSMIKLFTYCLCAIIFTLSFHLVHCDELHINGSSSGNVDLSKFKCSTGKREIAVYKRGDGIADCEDGSDEDVNRTGNHTILYFVWYDKNAQTSFLKGIYVNSTARGEFQMKIPACYSNWKILYADKSQIHLRCFMNDVFQIMSVTRDGLHKRLCNFTLPDGNENDLLGFVTNSSIGKPAAYFKYKNYSSTLIKVCTEENFDVEYCPNLKFNHSKNPEYLVFSPKNNGTLFWLEKEGPSRALIVKYSMNTSRASYIGSELILPSHLTKDAATNRLYVQVVDHDYTNLIVQSFNFNGEQVNKVKENEEEMKQFAVHNKILYWQKDKKTILFCSVCRSECAKTTKQLDHHLGDPRGYELKGTLYAYNHAANLEVPVRKLMKLENVQYLASVSDVPNRLVIYGIVVVLSITCLFVVLAYTLGKKEGKRAQSMDIHDDIITGTLRRKPYQAPEYAHEESLLKEVDDSQSR